METRTAFARRVAPIEECAFPALPPSAIADTRLAALFAKWDDARAREGASFPSRRHLPAESLARWWPALTLLEFEGPPAELRLRIRVHGGDIVDLDGANHTGRLLAEAYPANVQRVVRPGYAHVAECGRAVYHAREGGDLRGYPAVYEKLLLPLAGPDGALRYILNCLYLTRAPDPPDRDFEPRYDAYDRFIARGSFD